MTLRVSEHGELNPTKVLYIGGNLSQNKGGAAIILSSHKALRNYIPNIEFAFTSIIPKYDSGPSKYYGIRMVSEGNSNISMLMILLPSRLIRCLLWNIFNSLFNQNISCLLNDDVLNEYAKSDIVLEVSGDGLSGDYGIFSAYMSFSRILFCVLLKKNYIIYAQSIGPYNIKWPFLKKHSPFLSLFCKHIAKYTLNKADLITAREPLTLEILRSLGIITPPIYLTSDSAFLLDSAPDSDISKIFLNHGINQTEKLIGISVSESISMLNYDSNSSLAHNTYEDIISHIVDYVTEKFNMRVVFIPHVTGPGLKNDDRIKAQKIYNNIKNKSRVILIFDDLGPEILKGMIGRCELFIGSRMHANIAAISMRVPTIAIGYSHKTRGIMTAAGQEDFICDFNKLSLDDITQKIDAIWENRDSVKRELDICVSILELKAGYNAKLVAEFLSDTKSTNGAKKG